MFSEETMVDVLVLRVQVVENNVGIAGVTGSEDDYLEVSAQVAKDFLDVRTDVDACLDDFPCREGNRQLDIVWRCEGVVAVDEGLI